ncbi:MAG TPA: dTDP-4-dehydrorhamnose 3,5-epimerase [Ignavibacteriaceae bacterium]|nr:dTDP-4-dehydrorhamnose 3,5-epimerase [Ignavibacteriaceae bacterium]
MEIIKTDLNGVLLIKPKVYSDARGYFLESYKADVFNLNGIKTNLVQDNISKSVKGTIRGLHYQVGKKVQAKLCQVIYGRVLDVAVDIRFNSPTFGKHFSLELSDQNHFQVWIPAGFAHGFSVLSEEAIFYYKCSNYYSKEDERSIRFNDPELGIDWKVDNPLISEKDLQSKLFREIVADFYFSKDSH